MKERVYEIGDLPPNNWRAAFATFKRMKEDGTWKLDFGEFIVMLQDDPTELLAAMVKWETENEEPDRD